VAGQAKVRGATSAGYPKQSYTLKFDDEELGVEEWGHKTRGHIVLIITFDDASHLRQKLVYDLYRAMADHQGVQRLVPRTFFAVVYHGLYVGCDRIDDELARHSGFADGEGNLVGHYLSALAVGRRAAVRAGLRRVAVAGPHPRLRRVH
jgi:hypothetical protein